MIEILILKEKIIKRVSIYVHWGDGGVRPVAQAQSQNAVSPA